KAIRNVGQPETRSKFKRRDCSDCGAQWFKLVVRVDLVHFRGRMAGELLSDFLRDASVCHCTIKRMSQAVKAEARQRSPTACLYPFALNLGSVHDRSKTPAQSESAASVLPSQSRKHRCLPDSWFLQKFAFKLWVQWDGHGLLSFARRKSDDFVAPINCVPPHVYHVAKSRTRVVAEENCALPVALSCT